MRSKLFCTIAFTAVGLHAQTVTAVVNAASSVSLVAPGTWVAIYGTSLAPSAMAATAAPFPTELNKVMVTFAGKAAPLSYVSANQINAFIPFEAATLAAGGTQNIAVVVTTPTGTGTPYNLLVFRGSPGIFTLNQAGSGDAVAFDPSFKAVATVGTDPIVLYASGLGPTSPAASTYALGNGAEPLNRLVDPITINVGGKPAKILYAGLAPGLHGIYQINIVPPENPLGNGLSIAVGNNSGRSVTLPIAGGKNVSNLKGSIDLAYPANGTVIGSSAFFSGASYSVSFDIKANAAPFLVSFRSPYDAANILIDPVAKTWTASHLVPTATARAGDFSKSFTTVYDFFTCTGAVYTTCSTFPGGFVPASRFDPDAQRIVNLTPLPTIFTATAASGTYQATGPLPAGGHFEINSSTLPELAAHGLFQNFAANHLTTQTGSFSVIVDNVTLASTNVTFSFR